jgi:hypothetical protein
VTSFRPSGADELEVAELADRFRRDDRDLLLELLETVDETALDVLGGLAGAVRVGVAEHHRLAAADALRHGVAVGVRLPRPLRGEARVGEVALRLPVTDEEHVVHEPGDRLLRRHDLLVAAVLGERSLTSRPARFHSGSCGSWTGAGAVGAATWRWRNWRR